MEYETGSLACPLSYSSYIYREVAETEANRNCPFKNIHQPPASWTLSKRIYLTRDKPLCLIAPVESPALGQREAVAIRHVDNKVQAFGEIHVLLLPSKFRS